MRILSSIISIALRVVFCFRQQCSNCRRVTAKPVRRYDSRRPTLSLQNLSEEPLCRHPIASTLGQDTKNISVLVHGSPKVEVLTIDLQKASSTCQRSEPLASRRFNAR